MFNLKAHIAMFYIYLQTVHIYKPNYYMLYIILQGTFKGFLNIN